MSFSFLAEVQGSEHFIHTNTWASLFCAAQWDGAKTLVHPLASHSLPHQHQASLYWWGGRRGPVPSKRSFKKSWLPRLCGRWVCWRWCPAVAMHTVVSSYHARDGFKELWQQGHWFAFSHFPLWRGLSSEYSIKEEQSECLGLQTLCMSVGSDQHFFPESIEMVSGVSCSCADIISCLLYFISFRRQNNVLICLGFVSWGTSLFYNLSEEVWKVITALLILNGLVHVTTHPWWPQLTSSQLALALVFGSFDSCCVS